MNKKTSLLFLSFFSIIILFNVVNAVPPVTTVDNFPQGYLITESQQSYLLVDEPHTYNFFVFNASTGKTLDNSTVQCMFFLGNLTGDVLIMDNATYDLDGYWKAEIASTFFTYPGEYPYGVNCHSTDLGGALAGTFNAVYADWDVQESVLSFGIIFILTILLGFCIYNVVINENLGWKLGFLSTAYIILMGLTYSLLSISRIALFHVPTFEIIFNTLWIILVPGFFVYVLGIIIYLIFTALKEQEIKSFVARGFSEEEARSKTRDK